MWEWENNLQYKILGNSASVVRCSSHIQAIEVPREAQGFSIEGLEPYAFEGAQVEEVTLPEGIRRIGRYCFYNCEQLRHFSCYTDIADIGSGAFCGCHRVERLTIHRVLGEKSCFRELLSEFTEELEVWYEESGQWAHLYFPAYFEEGVENTPARIIENHVHGAGMNYRNSFSGQELKVEEYDRLFSYAAAWEREDFLIRLTLGRLLYPYRLLEQDRRIYENWLSGHLEQAMRLSVQEEHMESLRLLAQKLNAPYGVLEGAREEARGWGRSAMVSFLTEELSRRKRPMRKTFTLGVGDEKEAADDLRPAGAGDGENQYLW